MRLSRCQTFQLSAPLGFRKIQSVFSTLGDSLFPVRVFSIAVPGLTKGSRTVVQYVGNVLPVISFYGSVLLEVYGHGRSLRHSFLE